jgi:hypothetical protein
MKALLAALAFLALGGLAHADQSTPQQLVGGVYNATPPALQNGQEQVFQLDGSGRLLTTQNSGANYGNQANFKSGSASATGTAATTIIAAPTAGKLYVGGVQCGRTDSGTSASYVTLNDSASTILVLTNNGGGGGNNQAYSPPLIVAAMTALTFTSSASLTTVYCNAQAYNAP